MFACLSSEDPLQKTDMVRVKLIISVSHVKGEVWSAIFEFSVAWFDNRHWPGMGLYIGFWVFLILGISSMGFVNFWNSKALLRSSMKQWLVLSLPAFTNYYDDPYEQQKKFCLYSLLKVLITRKNVNTVNWSHKLFLSLKQFIANCTVQYSTQYHAWIKRMYEYVLSCEVEFRFNNNDCS